MREVRLPEAAHARRCASLDRDRVIAGVLQVADLAAEVDRGRAARLRFRNDILTGPGGAQILLEDPSGNPVELFQPAH